MCRRLEIEVLESTEPVQSLLTEENLRLHSVIHLKTTTTHPFDLYYQYIDNYCAESDDGNLDARRNIDLRRAASLEALQAYGGCFVSGFLAMHEPLPWTSPTTIGSASSGSIITAGSPRPDSDTLSHTDVQELSDERERKRHWKSMTRLRNAGRKLKR